MATRLWLLLGCVAALRGSTYLPTHIALRDLSAVQLVALQLVLATALVVTVAAVRGELRMAWGELRAHPARAAVLSTLFCAAPMALVAYGVRHVPTGLSAVLVAPSPIFGALLAAAVGAAPTGRGWVGLGIGMAGVALVAGPQAAGSPLAIGALLGAAACYAGAAYALRRWYADSGVTSIGLCAALPGTVVSVALMVATDPLTAVPSAGPLVATLLLGVAGLGIATLLFIIVLKHAGPTALLVTFMNPVVALLLGTLADHEAVRTAALAGIAVVAIGAALTAQGRAPRPVLATR